jgi:serine/threonine protein kinase
MLGINYLHLQCVTHRDLKPENILLVSKDIDNFDVKISDLGFAQEFNKEEGESMTLVLGSPLYMSPELVSNKPYTEKVDVWSLGVITYQLLSGKTPFESRNIKRIDYNIQHKPIKFENANGEFWDEISQEAKDFILACLERNPDKRPSVA